MQTHSINIGIFSVLLTVIIAIFSMYMSHNKEITLKQQVSEVLGAETEEVIIEDLTEDSFFYRKNENLRKVVFKGNQYIVEVDGEKIDGFTKE